MLFHPLFVLIYLTTVVIWIFSFYVAFQSDDFEELKAKVVYKQKNPTLTWNIVLALYLVFAITPILNTLIVVFYLFKLNKV